MFVIDSQKFDLAVTALFDAAKTVADQNGLRVVVDFPRGEGGSREPMPDVKRLRAITMGAITALVNGPAIPADEAHFAGALSPLHGRNAA